MGANSKIEWTHHTFNPWIGCSKVSAGCANCYAEEMMDHRYGRAKWGDGGTRVRTRDANWRKPLQWDKAAAAAGERHRVFCASLADVFELKKSELIGWRADLFHLISLTPNLDWLLLTKRPENISPAIESAWAFWSVRSYYGPQYAATRDMLKDWEDGNPPSNLWIGTSVENQEQADKRIPELLKIPAKVRFLSMEPLLGPVSLQSNKGGTQWIGGQRGCDGTHKGIGTPECPKEPHHHHDDRCNPGIDWVIAGGESGHNARPMHPDWARSLRDQCQAAGVPFFMKQMDKKEPIPPDLFIRELPEVIHA